MQTMPPTQNAELLAEFILHLATVAMLAITIGGVGYVIGLVIQSRVRTRKMRALRQAYGIAGKPITPPSEQRNRRRAA